MKVEVLKPKPNKRVEFSLGSFKFLPESMGCYVLTNFNSDIIYVGLAKNLNSRAKQHFDNPEKHVMTDFGKVYWFHFVVLNDEKKINQTERGWMNQYKLEHGSLPPLNKIESPSG